MRWSTGALALLFCFSLPARAAQPQPAVQLSAQLSAQEIDLFSDRGLLIASGGVVLRMPGLKIGATRAVYDLRANRLTAAGDVSVTSASGTLHAKGYVYDFATRHGAATPNAVVPQLPSADAIAIAQQVELHPATSITFTNAQVRAGTTLTPVASYSYAIPPPNAKDFGYSPVPAAALEWPVLLTNGRNAYSFARFRYDRYNGGFGAGLEEHYARTDRGYIALGETLDTDGARLDLGAYQRLNQSLSQSLTGSTLFGVRTARYALMSSGRQGYASLSFAQYNGMRSDDLYVTGNQHPIARLGSVRFQADLGHDVHPADHPVAQDFRLTPGLHIDSASLRIGPASLSSSADIGESVYNYGRGTLASDITFWANLPMNAHLLWNAGATFSHDAPPFPSTYRTYTLAATWRASRAFNLVSSFQYAHDYGQIFQAGRPEYSAAFDVRIRRKNGSGFEVGTILPFGGVGDMSRQAVLNFRFFK